MRRLNRVTLIGNCGKEPEYKLLEDGTPVAKIALATTEST
jgi:single-stranded DNA-binding protein